VGTLDFNGPSLMETELPWKWTFARHEIVLEIDPHDDVTEVEERNNRLLIHSNALGVGVYVERTYWESATEKMPQANIGVATFDDFVQKHIRRFNEMAANAIYPETPQGVLDRWRIDEIHLVEDGVIPLAAPYPEARDWGAGPDGWGTLYPNVKDYTVDIQWGFTAVTSTYWPEYTPWILMIGNSTIHEFAHARTMIDTYAWNVAVPDDILRMKELPLATNGRMYSTRQHGLMHFDWGHLDRYSAAAMNRMTGRRAIRGNYNEPWDLGWFLNDLPQKNVVRLVRLDGTPLANRGIRIYQPTGEQTPFPGEPAYRLIYNETPSLTLTTDANGSMTLGRNPIAAQDLISRVDQTNGVAIVEIDDAGTRRWAFLDSLEFNLAYWRGETEEAHYELIADAEPCIDLLGPSAVLPYPEALVTTPGVTFEIPAQGLHEYHLFYTLDGGPAQTVKMPRPVLGKSKTTLPLPPGHVVWWFVDETTTAGCVPQHSSIYAFDHTPAAKPRGRAVRH
jgi:hypothetical protein